MFYLDDLARVNYSLLTDPSISEKITNVLATSYQKVQDAYSDFIRSDAFKKLAQAKQYEVKIRFNSFELKAKRYEVEHASVIRDTALQSQFNPEELKVYRYLIAKNVDAHVIGQRLDIAETFLGKDNEAVQNALATLSSKNVTQVYSVFKNFDEKIKSLYGEIAKADPSQRSIESLQRVLNALYDLMNELNRKLSGQDLSMPVAKALAKMYLTAGIRFDQLSSEVARDRSALTVIIGNNVVMLPQIIRADVEEMRKIANAQPSINRSTQELAKNIWNAGSKVTQKEIDQQNVLIDQINKVPLYETSSITNDGSELVEGYVKGLQAKAPAKESKEGGTESPGWDI